MFSSLFFWLLGLTEERKKISICMKGISYVKSNMIMRTVEWIELQKILGIDKIFFHYTNLMKDMLEMLQYYEKENFIELREFLWAGPFLQ